MRLLLILLFSAIFLAMVAITTLASLDRSLFAAGEELLPDRWFQATLCDAYFGFLTFFVWVAYKETTLARRFVWFVLIMLFGNLAVSAYVLMQLVRLRPGDPWERLLLRRSAV